MPFAVGASGSSRLTSPVRDLQTTHSKTRDSMVKADAVAKATAVVQRDMAARLAEHGESIFPSIARTRMF